MKRIALAVLFLVLGASAYSQMYKWVDKDGKVQYSDKPPPQDAKQKGVLTKPSQAIPPSGEAKGRTDAAQPGNRKGAATQDSFRPEEQTALKTLCAIHLKGNFNCKFDLKRFCSLQELVTGIGGDSNKGLITDPRLDPNYEYRLDPRGEEMTISAIPRKPGLAGFFDDNDGTRYNLNGPAGKNDQKIEGGVSCGGMYK